MLRGLSALSMRQGSFFARLERFESEAGPLSFRGSHAFSDGIAFGKYPRLQLLRRLGRV